VVVNGQKVTLEHTPLIYNDSSYLPINELGSYLGALVNWKEDTKTIYINSRIYQEQPETSADVTYDEIKLSFPNAYSFDYLGAQYPVLMMTGNATYYRLSDIRRMGIDTNGLRKAKEIYTKALYVSEKELSTRWKQRPQMHYVSETPLVTGEIDPKKLEALRGYVKATANMNFNNEIHYSNPIIIDALSKENEYEYLLTDNGRYFRTHLTLNLNQDGSYSVSSASKVNIETTIAN
jgi:hypothetical protein